MIDHAPSVAAPASLREADLPDRVVVGKNGAYWRDYGDSYSMCPVSTDNDPVVPVAVYVRVENPPAATDDEPGTANGRDLLAHAVQYNPVDADRRITAAKIIAVEDEARAALRAESVAAPAASNDIRDVIWKLRHRGEAWGMVPDDDLALALERALAAAPPALDAAPIDVERLAAAMAVVWPGWLEEAPTTAAGREEIAEYANSIAAAYLRAATQASGEPARWGDGDAGEAAVKADWDAEEREVLRAACVRGTGPQDVLAGHRCLTHGATWLLNERTCSAAAPPAAGAEEPPR